SVNEAPYVGSVYLRAERTGQIGLSTNHISTVCNVGPSWSRCFTPVGFGNGCTCVQRQFHYLAPGDYIDVYIWGAQVERGYSPSQVENTSVSPFVDYLRSSVLPRFQLIGWPHDQNVQSRLATYAVAWSFFLQHPVAGVGL